MRLQGLSAVSRCRTLPLLEDLPVLELIISSSYWDWTLDAQIIEASPLFDGSDSSMSGNGIDYHPCWHGRGCVNTGPFANITLAFGQVSQDVNPELRNNPHNLDYKPRCLRRDLSPRVADSNLAADNVRALLSSPNITVFNQLMNAGATRAVLGVHRSGHLSVGADKSDFYSSPGDPIFYLHHTQIDRLWTQWQQLEPKTRQYTLSGTGTLASYPPSPNFRLRDTINLGKLSPQGPRPIRNFMSTVRGPFCYRYA